MLIAPKMMSAAMRIQAKTERRMEIAMRFTQRLYPREAWRSLPIQDHLAGLAGPHDLEALERVVDLEPVGDDRADIETALEHARHLVPGLVHLAAVDALEMEPLEDHLAPVDRDRVGEDPEHR